MPQLDTIEFKECLFETQSQALYRVLHNGISRTIRFWNEPLSSHDIDRLQYVHAHEAGLSKIHNVIAFEERCAFITHNCSGVPLSQIQSNLSPKMVYEIVEQVLTILHSNHLTFDSINGIFLGREGTLSISAPDISFSNQQIDGVWQLGWWALERLSSMDAHLARRLIEEGKHSEYNALLQTALQRLELGLPNQQWTDSAIQSFQYVCAFEPYKRWTADTAKKMFQAYADQAIGLSISQFCTQHHRLLEKPNVSKGNRTGQVHPVQEWKPQEDDIPGVQEVSKTQGVASLFNMFKKSTYQKQLLKISLITFISLHLVTTASIWLFSSQEKPASVEEDSAISIEITHDGIKQLVLRSDNPPDNDSKVDIKLTRSKRDLSTTIPPGIYELRVKHNRKKYRALVRLEESSRLECTQTNHKTVECTHNNRSLAWE